MTYAAVSFQGRVPVHVNQAVKDTRAEELASAINNIHHLFGSKPIREVSGKSMMEKNPGCFDFKTHCLTQIGEDCFNKGNKEQLGVTSESKVSDFIQSMKNFILNNADENGKVYRSFDTLV